MGVRDFTIYDFIVRNARLHPDREAVVFKETRLTHGEYKARCDRLAAGLLREGVAVGDRLGVVAHNSDEFLVLYGAAARIGAIVLPVNWRFQQEEVEYVLADCTPKMAFAGPGFEATVAQAAKRVGSIERCYVMGGGEAPGGFRPFASLYADEGPGAAAPVPPESGFVIIHTAAVQGRPRGALLSQANIVAGNFIMMTRQHLGPDDCHIGILPLFHIAGLALSMAVMHAGGKNVVVERFDAELTLRLIEAERGTTFFNFAPILQTLVDRHGQCPCDLSSLRHVQGLDHPDTLHAFTRIAPHATFLTGFGQTEAMGVTGGPYFERPGSAGTPSLLSRVAILDDDDQEVPVGAVGEICVRSPTVFLGYWGRDDDNARTFRNGWHHTGDMGRLDEDGYLWYVKRKAEKELIKPGGENVYPAEVEQVILEHGAVAQACVIGVPDRNWGEAIKAVCVLEAGASLAPQELIDFVASRIARYKKPQHVVFVDALPRTSAGEIDRDAVKKQHGGKY
jgi:long-chain acyl-CoA synthetase